MPENARKAPGSAESRRFLHCILCIVIHLFMHIYSLSEVKRVFVLSAHLFCPLSTTALSFPLISASRDSAGAGEARRGVSAARPAGAIQRRRPAAEQQRTSPAEMQRRTCSQPERMQPGRQHDHRRTCSGADRPAAEAGSVRARTRSSRRRPSSNFWCGKYVSNLYVSLLNLYESIIYTSYIIINIYNINNIIIIYISSLSLHTFFLFRNGHGVPVQVAQKQRRFFVNLCGLTDTVSPCYS
jgi:hypothetical protein